MPWVFGARTPKTHMQQSVGPTASRGPKHFMALATQHFCHFKGNL